MVYGSTSLAFTYFQIVSWDLVFFVFSRVIVSLGRILERCQDSSFLIFLSLFAIMVAFILLVKKETALKINGVGFIVLSCSLFVFMFQLGSDWFVFYRKLFWGPHLVNIGLDRNVLILCRVLVLSFFCLGVSFSTFVSVVCTVVLCIDY